MTTVIERRTPVVEGPILPEPPVRPTPRYVRWLAWLLGIALVVGARIVVWRAIDEPETPPIASIDLHDSPEVHWVLSPITPPIGAIDPHDSPEILRLAENEVSAPQAATIDPHQSPEILRVES